MAAVNYPTLTRTLALMESRALRGYAKAGTPPPPYRPIDMWDEWTRQQHTNPTSYRKTA